MSILNTINQTSQIRLLVQGLRTNGVSVPRELTDEIKLLDSVRTIKAKKDAERASSLNDLSKVPVDEFEDALNKAQSLWAENDPADEFSSRVEAVHYQRVISALYNASSAIMGEIEGKINGIVDACRLNEVSLPQDLATFDVMRSTPEDLDAINAYRQATPSMSLLWGSYKQVAAQLGHDLAAREFSSALDVAFLVSDVDTFNSARGLANRFEVLRMGVDSMKNIQQLGLWGLVNLSGQKIEMRSIEEAQFRRQEVQFPAVQEKAVSNRTAGFMLQ